MKKIFSGIIIFLFSVSCDNTYKKNEDTATYGEISIASDEAFKEIVQAELDVFHAIYTHAKINVKYVPEDLAFNLLANDSVRVIFSSKELTKEDSMVFQKIKITPRVSKVAIDGVAVIINKSNPDSLLLMSSLEKILKGEYRNWASLNVKNKLKDIKVVFDNGNSSNLRFIKDKFNLSKEQYNQYFSAEGSENLVEFVKNNPNSIGFIGVNWISDSDDSTAISFKNSVTVCALANDSTYKIRKEFFQPYQAYLAQDMYPLSRNLYIIGREARVGLGTGLTAFVNSERGQRIILKAGLVPANVPLRIVNLKNKMP